MKKIAVVFIVSLICCGSSPAADLKLDTEVPRRDMLQMQNRYAELEKHMEKEIGSLATAPTSKLWYLCNCYSSLKKYNKLFSCLDRMEQNIARGDTRYMYFDMSSYPFQVRAQAYIETGQYNKAVEAAQKAYGIVQEKKLSQADLIGALEVLGISYALNGDPIQAQKYALLLEQVKIKSADHVYEFMAKNIGLAKIFLALGNYQNALKSIRMAEDPKVQSSMAFTRQFFNSNTWAFIELPRKYMLNKCLYETGAITEAKRGFDILLANSAIQNNGDIYWMSLYDRGRIAEKEGDLKTAESFYKHAVTLIEQQRSTINTEANKIGFVGDKQNVYSSLVSLLFAQSRYAEAFESVESAKARALVDMLASDRKLTAASNSSQEKSMLIEKLDAAEIKTLIQDETITADQANQQRAVVIKLKNEIRSTNPELASLISVTPLNANEIQQAIPPDETLVEYFITDDTLFTFIVSCKEVRGLKLELKNLRQEIELFREHIMTPGSNQYKKDGHALFKKLIQPIEGMIGPNKLTIVPHGALHYLPFNALYLRLSADLVTLSACETALGKVANGDDVVGFTRGFLYAGAISIVSSLWKVDDQATSILMQEFYKSLRKSDKRSALRTAQLKVKNTYNSHPYYWAAFQITGSGK